MLLHISWHVSGASRPLSFEINKYTVVVCLSIHHKPLYAMAWCLSVCPFVRRTVTCQYCIKTAEHIILQSCKVSEMVQSYRAVTESDVWPIT